MAVITLLCLAAGCGGDDPKVSADLPEIPTPATESLPAAARERIEALLTAVRATPSNAEANGALGRALQAAEQYQGAEALYTRAAAFEPGALRWPYYLGVVRNSQGKYAEAAEAFTSAEAIDSSFPPLQYRLAETRLSMNEPSAARALYEKILAADPNSPTAHYGLGRALALEGDAKSAIAQFQQAVQAAPRYAQAHYELDWPTAIWASSRFPRSISSSTSASKASRRQSRKTL
ncbi:MAG: tetratricopeptide repeat protein [Bryobacterales bacterium]